MSLPIRRPGARTSGGYLDNVAGVIRDAIYKVGKTGTNAKSGKAWTAISVVLNLQQDGKAEVEKQFLPAGFLYADQKLSADNKSIVGGRGYFIDGDTEYGKFALSTVEDAEGNERAEVATKMGDGRSLNYLDNLRVVFKRTQDRAATIAAGAKKLGPVNSKTATEDQLIEAGKRPGKKGTPNEAKKYMLDQLTVGDVVGYEAAAAGGKKTAAKTTAAAPVATAAPATTISDADADSALQEVLAANGGQLERAKFSPAFLRYASGKKLTTEQREPLRKLLVSDDYVNGAAERQVIVIDGEGKAATLILVPTEESAVA